MVDFGYPIGPFAIGRSVGARHRLRQRQRRAAAVSRTTARCRSPTASSRPDGWARRPAPAGIRYETGDRTPHPDPEVARMIKETAAELGIPQQSFSDEEILHRLLFASVNEACKILDEGKALPGQRHRRDVAAAASASRAIAAG